MRPYRRRRSKKAEAEAIGTLLMLGFAGAVISGLISAGGRAYKFLTEVWNTAGGRVGIIFAVAFPVGAVSFVSYLKSKKKRNLQEEYEREVAKVEISDRREDYFIEGADYKRGNPKENLYRKALQLHLFHVYNNSCAKCGRNDNGVDIDHFFLSKNEGGNFIMRHKKGHLINNAVPLCQSCNRSKSDRSYKEFYSPEEILTLFRKNAEMTRALNEK